DGQTPPPDPTTPASIPNSDEEIPRKDLARKNSIRPSRSVSAVAWPVSGITIDGRLDDWPKDLQSYPIEHQLLDRSESATEPEELIRDPEAHFQVGYDRQAGLIYLAVVVRDDEHVVAPATGKDLANNLYKTDAVEVYIDGTYSNRKISEPSGD